MTMPTDEPRREFIEDGVTTIHPIGFKFIDRSHITVTRIDPDGDETLLVDEVDYTVSGGGFDIGQIVKANGGTAGYVVRIDRNTTIDQPLDYIQGDDFSAESHERGLDRLTMIAQELRRDILTVRDVQDIIAAMLLAGEGIQLSRNADGDELTIVNTFNAAFIIATIGEALIAGIGIELTVDEGAGTITITNSASVGNGIGQLADMLLLSGDQQAGGLTGTGDGSFAEQVRSIIAAALQGVGITVTENDGANTISLTNEITAEFIRDTIAAALVGSFGVTVTPNDAGDQIIITGSGGGGISLEDVRDMLATVMVPGTNIAIEHNDGGDQIVVSCSALDASYKGLVPTDFAAAFNFTDDQSGRALNLTGGEYAATLRAQSVHALSSGWAVAIRNDSASAKAIDLGAGVALYKNGGTVSASAILAPGSISTIQRWSADEFTISGPGVS